RTTQSDNLAVPLALCSGKTRKGEAIMFAPRWMMQARQRFHSPRLRNGFTLLRPRLEELENRCLPSGAGWFDAPWRGYGTGYFPNGFGPHSLALGDLDCDGDPRPGGGRSLSRRVRTSDSG